MSVRHESDEIRNFSAAETVTPKLVVISRSTGTDHDQLDREQLARLGKRSVLKVDTLTHSFLLLYVHSLLCLVSFARLQTNILFRSGTLVISQSWDLAAPSS
jgi:hypothetical protein